MTNYSSAMARSQASSAVLPRVVAVLLVAMLFMMDSFADAATLTVGGDKGWTMQEYGEMTAQTGDVLQFNYNPKVSDVLEVSEEDYHKCHRKHHKGRYNSGKDSIPLNSAGKNFYISGFGRQCHQGQKVTVTVK
jgi:hypothetical protein